MAVNVTYGLSIFVYFAGNVEYVCLDDTVFVPETMHAFLRCNLTHRSNHTLEIFTADCTFISMQNLPSDSPSYYLLEMTR